jgi:UDP-glucose 4-epimerase
MSRTVLVAGGAGYIGSHRLKMVSREGWHAVTLDNLSEGHRDAVVAGAFIEGRALL